MKSPESARMYIEHMLTIRHISNIEHRSNDSRLTVEPIPGTAGQPIEHPGSHRTSIEHFGNIPDAKLCRTSVCQSIEHLSKIFRTSIGHLVEPVSMRTSIEIYRNSIDANICEHTEHQSNNYFERVSTIYRCEHISNIFRTSIGASIYPESID